MRVLVRWSMPGGLWLELSCCNPTAAYIKYIKYYTLYNIRYNYVIYITCKYYLLYNMCYNIQYDIQYIYNRYIYNVPIIIFLYLMYRNIHFGVHFKYKHDSVQYIATSFFFLLNNMFWRFFPSQMCVCV